MAHAIPIRGRHRPQFHYVAKNISPPVEGRRWVLECTDAVSPYTETGHLKALCSGTQQVPYAIVERGVQRVVRAGLPNIGLEIFWVNDVVKWGVRARSALLPGSFVCEYAGEVVGDSTAERRSSPGRDAYLFDLPSPEAWRSLGAVPLGPPTREEPSFVIDAFQHGNIGRLLNHACGPSLEANVAPVYVFVDEELIDVRLPKVAFFTLRSIDAGEELRYDYSMQPDSVCDKNGNIRNLACLCGSSTCRGQIY